MDKEKITLDKLAENMEKGFQGVKEHTNQKIDQKIDELSLAVAKGFEGVDKRFEHVDKRFDRVETRLDGLEQGQEAIKLRLDNVAYRFEVKDLDERLKIVEARLGISKKT